MERPSIEEQQARIDREIAQIAAQEGVSEEELRFGSETISRQNNRKPVVRVDSKVNESIFPIYPSSLLAGRLNGLPFQNICRAVKTGKRCGRFYWLLFDEVRERGRVVSRDEGEFMQVG